MRLKRVTLTGADCSVNPEDLIHLSLLYPFVEWGILVSQNNTEPSGIGYPRWPSHPWIEDLQRRREGTGAHLSLHLCGRWVRELLVGSLADGDFPPDLLRGFRRVQLNFHGERPKYDRDAFVHAVAHHFPEREVIFQVDGAHGTGHLKAFLNHARKGSTRATPLFDLSHGAGVLPGAWPDAGQVVIQRHPQLAFFGYAGGLGPSNVAQELQKIGDAAGIYPFWIDMETKLRTTPDGDKFDLAKCQQVLEACKPFVEDDFEGYEQTPDNR